MLVILNVFANRKKTAENAPPATADNGKKDQVKFHIEDEETEYLMKAPEIVIDPPSKRSSPTNSVE